GRSRAMPLALIDIWYGLVKYARVAPAPSRSAPICSFVREVVPRCSIFAVSCGSAGLSPGAAESPPRTTPRMATVGTEWFSMTSTMTPFERTRWVVRAAKDDVVGAADGAVSATDGLRTRPTLA